MRSWWLRRLKPDTTGSHSGRPAGSYKTRNRKWEMEMGNGNGKLKWEMEMGNGFGIHVTAR